MLYTIICILVVALAAMAVWVWEISNRLKRLDESTDTELSDYFKISPSWQATMESVLLRLNEIENNVFDEEKEGTKYYLKAVQNYADPSCSNFNKHCPPIKFLNEKILGKKTDEEEEKELIKGLKKGLERSYWQ